MTDYNTHALKHGYNNYAIVYTTTTLLVYMCLLVHYSCMLLVQAMIVW